MGIRDLFAAHADLLLDADTGLSEGWVYTPPGADPVPVEFSGIFDQLAANALDNILPHGEEIQEQGLLEAPITLAIDTAGTMTRASDSTSWRIQGIVGKDRELQTVQLARFIRVNARMPKRRGV